MAQVPPALAIGSTLRMAPRGRSDQELWICRRARRSALSRRSDFPASDECLISRLDGTPFRQRSCGPGGETGGLIRDEFDSECSQVGPQTVFWPGVELPRPRYAITEFYRSCAFLFWPCCCLAPSSAACASEWVCRPSCAHTTEAQWIRLIEPSRLNSGSGDLTLRARIAAPASPTIGFGDNRRPRRDLWNHVGSLGFVSGGGDDRGGSATVGLTVPDPYSLDAARVGVEHLIFKFAWA